MLIAALFTVAHSWSLPKSIISTKGKSGIVFLRNGILNGSDKNEHPSHGTMWMNFMCIVLSKRSQIPKITYYIISFYEVQK